MSDMTTASDSVITEDAKAVRANTTLYAPAARSPLSPAKNSTHRSP